LLLLLVVWVGQQAWPAVEAAPAATTRTRRSRSSNAALLQDASTTSVRLSSTAACSSNITHCNTFHVTTLL
jgi:hypothetical protein